jgi:hypothetical protein
LGRGAEIYTNTADTLGTFTFNLPVLNAGLGISYIFQVLKKKNVYSPACELVGLLE